MRRETLESVIEEHLKRLTAPLGYLPCAELPWAPGEPRGKADRIWWFTRSGASFRTELMCFLLRWRPRAVMRADFFGSPASVDDLARIGLEGNAVGESPFRFQLYTMNRPMADLLGEDVYLGKEADWPILFERWKNEIQAVDALIWADLERSWRGEVP
jgi:hypothetical protein